MANNRMYLRNIRTGIEVFIAKYYPSTGWYTNGGNLDEHLDKAFHQSDFGHLTPDQQLANQQHRGFDLLFPAASSACEGAEWELVFEYNGDGLKSMTAHISLTNYNGDEEYAKQHPEDSLDHLSTDGCAIQSITYRGIKDDCILWEVKYQPKEEDHGDV